MKKNAFFPSEFREHSTAPSAACGTEAGWSGLHSGGPFSHVLAARQARWSGLHSGGPFSHVLGRAASARLPTAAPARP